MSLSSSTGALSPPVDRHVALLRNTARLPWPIRRIEHSFSPGMPPTQGQIPRNQIEGAELCVHDLVTTFVENRRQCEFHWSGSGIASFFEALRRIAGWVAGSSMVEQLSGGDALAASCGIAVMAKASAPGRTKTRLVPPLTFDEAAALNTAFLKDVADNIGAAAAQASIAGYFAFGPPGSDAFFRAILPSSIGLIEAWYADFGECLYSAIDQILAHGHSGAVVLNSDSPTLPTSILVETAEVLARPGERAVLGPSTDGGYYLLGIKSRHHRLFEDVAWSTEQVARQTLERAVEIGLDVHVLPVWYDVDDAQALRLLHAELCESYEFSQRLKRHHADHSTGSLRALMSREEFAHEFARLSATSIVSAAE
jgi:rSAM/selenodomain-associated transferase 1